MYSMLQIVYFSIYKIIQTCKSPFYWIIIGIIFYQYSKIGKWERIVLGKYKRSLFYNVLTSIAMGFLGGIIGSIIFIYLGTIINLTDFYSILILAILLSLIHPRYMCFSYGGGIISLISLKFGYPNINVSEIMVVIGVLHLIESILIWLDGTRGRLPIFIDRQEGIVGGFTMNRFWPIPFTIFINKGHIYPVTIMAILGYGDLALANYPEKKSKQTAGLLFLFSIILIFLAQISTKYYIYKYIVAIFAPLAHELIITLGKKIEEKGNCIFKSSDRGVKVLDTLPNSIGKEMGFNPGDTILSINGYKIYYKDDVSKILSLKPSSLRMKVFHKGKGLIIKEYKGYIDNIEDLGLILVPSISEYAFQLAEPKGAIDRLVKKLGRNKVRFKN